MSTLGVELALWQSGSWDGDSCGARGWSWDWWEALRQFTAATEREGGEKNRHPSSLLCKPGRCKWLYYSWECNSYNQLTGEPMKMLFIISENDITALDWVLSASCASTEVQHVALGWSWCRRIIKKSLLFACLEIANCIKTDSCLPLNEQCVSCAFVVTHKALPRYAKRSSEKTSHPLSYLFETVIPNQRLFSCCQSSRDSTSRSPKVESKRCSRCKKPLPRLFVALDNGLNLAISFNFAITNGQLGMQESCSSEYVTHPTFQKRSPEQPVMCTDLDLYYKWQWHGAK